MHCPNHNKTRWARAAQRATVPFASSGSTFPSGRVTRTGDNDESNKDNDAKANDDSLSQHNSGSEKEDGGSEKEDGGSEKEDKKGGAKTHIYYVPRSRQHNLNPTEAITSLENLKLYCRLSFGTCIIAPVDKPSFCKVCWICFESMKSSDPNQSIGRFCCVGKMKKAIQRAEYNPVTEAAGIQEASKFIAYQLQQLAPGVFESCRQLLINGDYPSMAQMELPAPYSPTDFASFLTFTM
ncbi:hypothetical protein PCANC_22123 [Puccinia coronata f. sp. avenae]|uniref:Tet-like 2OG-Fe(II) oxygenase domain-containing protein n=1 Tax=Puccinia coronata f. sp. avenae TaxID=200324 RepID=A0A2N5SHG3_9BASI|nr:hypothetical protein PCANC_22123 [Puccinia coronata f. sp. avenae]